MAKVSRSGSRAQGCISPPVTPIPLGPQTWPHSSITWVWGLLWFLSQCCPGPTLGDSSLICMRLGPGMGFFFFFFKLCHDWKTGPRQATTAGGDIATTSRLRKQRFLFHPRARCVSKRGKLLGGQGGLGKGEANSRNSLK